MGRSNRLAGEILDLVAARRRQTILHTIVADGEWSPDVRILATGSRRG
jgi:hypothetical protein